MISDYQRYRDRLLSLRHRAMGTVGHVAEAIQEDLNPSRVGSTTSGQTADIAELAVDSTAEILRIEGSLLDDIKSALARIDDGTYGRCEDCGGKISRARLDAIPSTSCCVDCAQLRDHAEKT